MKTKSKIKNDNVDVDSLVSAAKDVLNTIRLSAMMNCTGLKRLKSADLKSKKEEYDYSIIINDDKKAVNAINKLREALGE